MLVLTRKLGESIEIGADVRVTVVALPSGQVRLAIEAPPEVPIHRGEVVERIAEANRAAARNSTAPAGFNREESSCDPTT